MPTSSPLKAMSWLGFVAHPGGAEDYVAHLKDAIDAQRPTTVFAHNLHSLYLYYRSKSLRDSYRERINMVDGMPIIWLLKMAGFDVSAADRLTYVDFIWALLDSAEKNGWRVSHIGQTSKVQQRAMDQIKQRYPQLKTHAIPGYFDQSDNSADSLKVIQELNDFAPQILLVGLGSPRQEHWVAQHRELIQCPAVLSCGACMEYVAGEVGTPPRWMGRTGLEWSYRLLENPRRFASRYFLEPWALLYSMLRYAVSGRH